MQRAELGGVEAVVATSDRAEVRKVDFVHRRDEVQDRAGRDVVKQLGAVLPTWLDCRRRGCVCGLQPP